MNMDEHEMIETMSRAWALYPAPKSPAMTGLGYREFWSEPAIRIGAIATL
jgi:hypothetical protein